MQNFTTAQLAPMISRYIPTRGNPNEVTVEGLDQLSSLLEVTLTGKLIKKQLCTSIDENGKRTFRIAAQDGKYKRTAGDGDLHFCVGTNNGKVHVPCEIQAATNEMITTFNANVGGSVSVTGFFRCLFEHSGIVQTDNSDCHIFEIHPVRAVTIGGSTFTFEVDTPAEEGIHNGWMRDNVSLEDTDNAIRINQEADSLVFSCVQSDAKAAM
jgi:hypothetical protein